MKFSLKVLKKKVSFPGLAVLFAILGADSSVAQVIPVLNGLPPVAGAPVVVHRTPVIMGTAPVSQPLITPANSSAPVVTAFRAPLVAAPVTTVPVVTTFRAPLTSAPLVTTFRAPLVAAPVTAVPVVTTFRAPLVAAPVTAVPVVTTFRAPLVAAPVTAVPVVTSFRPVVAPVVAPVVPVQPVIVVPRSYVPRQPIRNFIRALTP